MFQSLKRKFIGDKAFYRSVLIILLPLVVQQGITSAVNLLDNLFFAYGSDDYLGPFARLLLTKQDLKAIGVTVVVHQILGLPGETPAQMAETAAYIGASGADGVKFHLLHVLRGTDLAADYEAGRFQTLDLPTYIAALEECVRRIPRSMVIHRLTGDGAKRDLIAPLWSGDKKRVLNAIHAAFRRDNVEQGSAEE